MIFFFKQKTAYEMRISDWSSDVCSSDLGFKPSTFKPAPPPIHHREQLTVALADGREVTLLRVRDPRARRMRLSVSERGVRLTLPRAVSLRAANAFVAEYGEDRKSTRLNSSH